MIASQTGIVKVMDGLLLWHIYQEQVSPTTTLMPKQDALEQSTLLLGYLTTKGFQRIWQIRFDCMGKLKGVSLM
jgi:hypothetical protein